MGPVVHHNLHILAIDLLVLLDNLSPGLISLIRPVDGHTVGLGVKQDPSTLEGAFHLLEFSPGMRLNQHDSGLFAFGRSCV